MSSPTPRNTLFSAITLCMKLKGEERGKTGVGEAKTDKQANGGPGLSVHRKSDLRGLELVLKYREAIVSCILIL